MFALEVFERDHAIRSDVGETLIERCHRLFVQRRTVHVSGAAKIVQQTLCLLVGKPVNQPVKFFFHRHNLIVALQCRTPVTGC